MRHDFDVKTKETLAKRVGYRCSNPDCNKLTSGPRSDPEKVLNIGVAAHITAASEGGPRYDPSLTPKQRRSVDNGIWLCQNCAKLVDNDVQRYTVALLREWKERAEEAALREVKGAAPLLPSPSPDAVARHRAALQERLEHDACTRWGGMSIYIQEEGATLPIEASPYDQGRLGSRHNLLQLLHGADRLDAHRLLILGGPGSGKTVSLERLAWELCAGQEPIIPVLVRLFHYDGKPLAEWLRALLQETGHLRFDDQQALRDFLKAHGTARCFFLFDGLNEVPPSCRDDLVGELVRWMANYPRHPTILTSRAQDELWRRLRAEVGRAVVVQPIGDEQARDYLVAHLGQRGDTLYNNLDERLRAMARTPLILWLIKEAGTAGESVPGNRGELYSRFVSRMLRRDTDRRMDADIREPLKRHALIDLAFHLGLHQRLLCPRDEAVKIVARRLGEEQADEVVGACARHGLLAGDDPLWFAPHHTVQEHFAALALQELAHREWHLTGWARRLLSGKEQGLAALAADDWWMETFVQLAGLVDEADRLALDVARVNPWLAWWCVAEGRGVREVTREAVADRSVRLLESRRVSDRRRAVGALAQVRSERVVQPLLRAAADPDPEVAGSAVQALIEMGEPVRATIAEVLRGANLHLWYGAVRYLDRQREDPLCAQVPDRVWQEVLGQPMVWVPPGPFLMGSDRARDPQAYDDELPQHEVTLPGYWIGRYPVTVAQFRAFVEASGHRPEDAGSLKGHGDHPVTYVTWHDALAFCRWLSERAGLTVTLPSEAEWEKAARGTDGRKYPWGDEKPTPDLCNYDGNEGGTTPVGKYSPRGDSPCGCVDVAGNVWEWTSSDYDDKHKVLRGGSWYDLPDDLRSADRSRIQPDDGSVYDGFRCCVASRQE